MQSAQPSSTAKGFQVINVSPCSFLWSHRKNHLTSKMASKVESRPDFCVQQKTWLKSGNGVSVLQVCLRCFYNLAYSISTRSLSLSYPCPFALSLSYWLLSHLLVPLYAGTYSSTGFGPCSRCTTQTCDSSLAQTSCRTCKLKKKWNLWAHPHGYHFLAQKWLDACDQALAVSTPTDRRRRLPQANSADVHWVISLWRLHRLEIRGMVSDLWRLTDIFWA